MAKQTINQGTAPTGAGGDTFRSGSAKLQANDNELYNWIGNGSSVTTLPSALPIAKGGTGATTAAAAHTSLGLGTAATATLTTSPLDGIRGRVLKVGDFGLGSFAWAATDPAETKAFGAYMLPNGSTNKPQKLGANDTAYIVFPRDIGALANGNYYHTALFVPYGSSAKTAAMRCFQGTLTTDYKDITFYSDYNTTVDSNGFVKAASPIVELYADRIELNDEAEQQDIVFEKLEVGDYLIKGSSGLAQEGWYVETPKDANGNVLFSVIYTTLENGDISVKTYKKKFDLETASIVADLENPVDITEKRWIDLRLQELPQPEIEVTDDPEQ